MKFKINRDHFVTGLQQVSHVVGTRPSKPILSNVLIVAREDHILLTTTNVDIGIRCQIKVEVEKPGEIALPVRRLTSIIRSLPHLEVEVDISPTYQAKIVSGRSFFRIMGMAPHEFPGIPVVLSNESSYTLPQATLLEMIRSVAYAQSRDETRYILNSIFFHMEEGKLTLVAADGRRLAIHTKEVDAQSDCQFILPARTTDELERLLGQGEQVKVSFNDRQVSFDIAIGQTAEAQGLKESICLVSRVVEGQYPDYKQAVPKQVHYRMRLDRELFQECVNRVKQVLTDKDDSIVLKLENSVLQLTGCSSEVGESRESMAVACEPEEAAEASFNPEFLLDILRSLNKDEVFFEFKDDVCPGIFRSLDGFLCIIMPFRYE